jgi:hypothetical protein
MGLLHALARIHFLVGGECVSYANVGLDSLHNTKRAIATHDMNDAIMAVYALSHLGTVIDFEGGHD